MSSRWDALKPSNGSRSSNKTTNSLRSDRGKPKNGVSLQQGSNHRTKTNNHARTKWQTSTATTKTIEADLDGRETSLPGQQQQQQIPGTNCRRRRHDNPLANTIGNSNDKSWRKGGAGRYEKTNDADEDVVSSNAEWNRLTRDLHEWGNATRPTHQEDTTAAMDGHEQTATITPHHARSRDLGTILMSISSHAKEEENYITGGQLGVVIAAALTILNELEKEEETVAQILGFCCDMLVDPSTRRHPSKRRNDNQHAQEAVAIRVTTIHAYRCINGLVHTHKCLADCPNTALRSKHHECCIRILICLANYLPPEETAYELVERILLPVLESIIMSVNTSSELRGNQEMLLVLGFQAIHSLLQFQKHASALLAPLVKDVAANGQELYLLNPLRKRTFQLFQNILQLHVASSQSIKLMETVYYSLATALQKANDVDKSSSTIPSLSSWQPGAASGASSSLRDLDAIVMERLFKGIFHRECFQEISPVPPLRKQILEVMLAYLKHHQDASLSMASILLLRDNQGSFGTEILTGSASRGNKNRDLSFPNQNANIRSVPPFLKLLHKTKIGSEEIDLLMASLALLVTQAPWKLWLGKTCGQRQGLALTMSNFSCRVSEALLGIVGVTTSLLRMHVNEWKSQATPGVDTFLNLLKATLLSIPYESIPASTESKQITEASLELFNTLSHLLVHDDRHQYAPLDRLVELYDESMGGRITPRGTRTDMIMPARSILFDSSSRSFLDEVFFKIARAAAKGTEPAMTWAKTPMKLLRSILRTRPETVLYHEADWKRYIVTIEALYKSNNATLQSSSLELLEALLVGRQHYLPARTLNVSSETVAKFAFNILPRTLQSQAGTCRRLGLLAYGCLLGSDWLPQGDQSKVGSIKHHIVLILGHGVPTEQCSSVRSAACKATGDICSNCFLELDQAESLGVGDYPRWRDAALELISQDVFAAMQLALKDGAAPVRSMVSTRL
jgi:hypothetical protein